MSNISRASIGAVLVLALVLVTACANTDELEQQVADLRQEVEQEKAARMAAEEAGFQQMAAAIGELSNQPPGVQMLVEPAIFEYPEGTDQDQERAGHRLGLRLGPAAWPMVRTHRPNTGQRDPALVPRRLRPASERGRDLRRDDVGVPPPLLPAAPRWRGPRRDIHIPSPRLGYGRAAGVDSVGGLRHRARKPVVFRGESNRKDK